MRRTLLSIAGIAMLCPAGALFAQPAPDPPKVLRIFREDVKEGKGPGHEKSEASFMEAAAKAQYPANILGMTTLTGTPQAWFLEAHDSFDSIAKAEAALDKPEFETLEALDAEFISGSRSWIAVYQPDLSFHGQEMMQALPKARYFNVTMMRVQSGHDQEFAEIGHMAVDASQKSINDQPVAVYQVVSGMPDGTYLLFEPSASLKALDSADERSRAMLQAMGDSGAARFLKAIRDNIASAEALLFVINPKMSYVSKDIAAADPDFWNQKPAELAKPAARKPAAKTARKAENK
ncbi:MAG TPA: hypothetical protein VEV17_19855 [Bryobacteraceae bacterium]|nr:hypothetical protein [Bryobacteraceae bacterium]